MFEHDDVGPVATWVADLPKKSVFIDGLSHDLFYLITATKPKEKGGYNAITVGKFGEESFKVKFYGGFAAWGFDRQTLKENFFAQSFLSRMGKQSEDEFDYDYDYDYAGYDRYYTDLNGLCLLIQSFQGNEDGISVASTREVLRAFEIPQAQREEMATKFKFDLIGEGMPGLPKLDNAALE